MKSAILLFAKNYTQPNLHGISIQINIIQTMKADTTQNKQRSFCDGLVSLFFFMDMFIVGILKLGEKMEFYQSSLNCGNFKLAVMTMKFQNQFSTPLVNREIDVISFLPVHFFIAYYYGVPEDFSKINNIYFRSKLNFKCMYHLNEQYI